MALPELIEIVPLTQPVRAEITVPGSKSITNRALILAALADGEVTLRGALWSEDTQVMTEALLKLGFEIRVENDPAESCNRTITVKGRGGKIPNAGTAAQPLELFVGNAGTAARFLAAFVCLGEGVYRLSGVPRMHERPQQGLFGALGELGYRIESENKNDNLPALIFAGPQYIGRSKKLRSRFCRVNIDRSSQFASALFMCARFGNWKIEIVGTTKKEKLPYVAMTSELIKAFPNNGGEFQIEPDASSASYFWAAATLAPPSKLFKKTECPADYRERECEFFDAIALLKNKDWKYLGQFVGTARIYSEQRKKLAEKGLSEAALQCHDFLHVNGSKITVSGWPLVPRANRAFKIQIDENFQRFAKHIPLIDDSAISRKNDLGDSIMTAIVIAPFIGKIMRFTGLGKLRFQECERVVALRTELTKCAVKVIEKGNSLKIYPARLDELHGAEIETYNDHRMAMCFAVLGLKVAGIKIINPACVKKTFPNFFQKLAEPPPHGLGAEIWEIKDGQRTRKLSGEDLFAD